MSKSRSNTVLNLDYYFLITTKKANVSSKYMLKIKRNTYQYIKKSKISKISHEAKSQSSSCDHENLLPLAESSSMGLKLVPSSLFLDNAW